jgi:hypothetical protein
MPPLFTASYSMFRPEHGVPVAVTVGLPKRFGYPLVIWRGPAPFGLFGAGLDEAAFRRKYRARLHRLTPRLLRELRDLREGYAPLPVVLLCYEPPGAFCHRHLLGEFLGELLGEPVTEVALDP